MKIAVFFLPSLFPNVTNGSFLPVGKRNDTLKQTNINMAYPAPPKKVRQPLVKQIQKYPSIETRNFDWSTIY